MIAHWVRFGALACARVRGPLIGSLAGGAAMVVCSGAPALSAEVTPHPAGGVVSHLARTPPLVWSAPFALLLLAIATFPLIPALHRWWEKDWAKLAVGLSLGGLVLLFYGFRAHGYHGHAPGIASVAAVCEHAIIRDYVPFIIMLFTLFVISGGLQVRGDLQARPGVNTAFLAFGGLLASLIGTTGASMLLIRPLLQTNRDREYVQHTVVFFIFVVSNIGGSLLPLGDPPLFLGYLSGVPFFWTLTLVAPWLFSLAVLLTVYFVWDVRAYRRETRVSLADEIRHVSPLRLHGKINILWLVCAVLTLCLIVPGKPLAGTNLVPPHFAREAVLLALVVLSLATTPRGLRKETEFSYAAISEVACLFAGIFLTMQVPVEILQANGPALGLSTPLQFFWVTGLLSSFLDNAPTYLVFLETAKSLPAPEGAALVALGAGSIRFDHLAAISLGAVFMGANTYIGNAPNMMVKLIAEQRQVTMPSFLGFMAYSGSVLLPLFVVVSLLFL